MERHHRRSIRLSKYDYSKFGYYYITVCTQDRELYFENNDIQQMINNQWRELKHKFLNINLDEYIIMPNHLHGIIVITDNNICLGGHAGPPLQSEQPNPFRRGRPMCLPKQWKQQPKPTLGQIIQWFKTMTTNYYIQGIQTKNWPMFNKRLWQRNYFEHIIRSQQSLNKIRQYIRTNPLNWETDRNNPKNWKNYAPFKN